MIKIKNKPAGFSLIELLFAMVFLSVIVFGVIKLQTSNVTLSHTKKLELKAHNYATQGLEIVDALGAVAVKDCDSGCYFDSGGDGYSIKKEGTEKLEGGLFERSFTHDQSELEGDATLVTMTVAWTDSSGDHRVEAKRVISE